MKQTLGSYLIATLEAQGVRHVFGIPGVHNLELYRGLAQSSIRHDPGQRVRCRRRHPVTSTRFAPPHSRSRS